jgi:anthranilate synthase component 1
MPTVETSRDAFRRTAEDAPSGVRIPVEVRATVSDPFGAYRRARDGPGGAYLETGGRTGWGYFAVDPIDRLRVTPEACSVSGGGSPTLSALAARLDAGRLVRGPCDVPYPCGAIGWLSYDVARELEELPASTEDDRGLPRLELGVFDRIAAWHGEVSPDGEGTTTLRICACPRVGAREATGESGDPPPDVAYDRGRERALALAERATEGDPAVSTDPEPSGEATFESDCGPAAFRGRVRRVKEYVRDGDTFQANVSHRLSAPATVHPVETFAALRRVNPAPYAALLEFPSADLVSASPELLLRRVGDRVVTEPIAGTRPRGETEPEDERLEADLRTDEKERAEHAMLVDLERNDLGKVSTYGSVDVSEYRRVDRYAEVMHLVSMVEGEMRPEHDLADAIAAVFPGGTITGAPKPRTMEIIDEVEETRRGPYTGSIGVFGFDGRATLNIVIRTLVRHAGKYHLRVGAGIVHDSVPDREYEETLDKARALVDAVSTALEVRADLAVEGETS